MPSEISIKVPDLSLLQIDIYDYLDLNALLQRYFQRCKEVDSRLSMRYFSESVFQKNTPGYVQSFLNKKQRLPHDVVKILSELLAVEGDELEYFLGLAAVWEFGGDCHLSEESIDWLSERVDPTVLSSLKAFEGKVYGLRSELLEALQGELETSWNPMMQMQILESMEIDGKSHPVYQFYDSRLKTLRQKHQTTLYEAQHQLLSSWKHWVILGMCKAAPSAPLEAAWFSAHLSPLISMDHAEIDQCLHDLQKAELLVVSPEGLQTPAPAVEIHPKSAILKKYHEQNLKQAILSLNSPKHERHYLGALVPTTSMKLQEAKKYLNRVQRELIQILESDCPDQLVSVASVLFQASQFNTMSPKEEL